MPPERDRSNVIVPIPQLAHDPAYRHDIGSRSALSGFAAVAIAFGLLWAASVFGPAATAVAVAAAPLFAGLVRRVIRGATRRRRSAGR